MDQMNIAQRMVDFYKMSFDHTLFVMMMLGDQTTRMFSTVLDQAAQRPDQNRKPMKDWVQASRTGVGIFKKAPDDNFTNLAYPCGTPAFQKAGPPPIPVRTR